MMVTVTDTKKHDEHQVYGPNRAVIPEEMQPRLG